MEFHLSLVNRQKIKWLLLYMLGWGGLCALAGPLYSILKIGQLNPFLGAGVLVLGLAVFIGLYWLFERVQAAIREPVCIVVLPNSLLMRHEVTGLVEDLQFSQLLDYRYYPATKAGSALRLSLRNGTQVKWKTTNSFLNSRNTEAFAAMVKAFEAAWVSDQQGS